MTLSNLATDDAKLNNTISLRLYYPTGEYELKEQVSADQTTCEKYSLLSRPVHHL